ncbi:hypothetical protein ACQR1I_35980 [Bradyrhizobium sp. HKCCYLS2038]|uniref:hypothetical protein n=1 Tax=Bradyrhizobium sp. HKCCYLS2038 TaxID=3420764 RepID=UPI003EBAB596
MIGIFIGNVRIGTIMKIEGEPPATRWFAYASNDRKQGFATRRQAVAWLIQLHKADQKGTKR